MHDKPVDLDLDPALIKFWIFDLVSVMTLCLDEWAAVSWSMDDGCSLERLVYPRGLHRPLFSDLPERAFVSP